MDVVPFRYERMGSLFIMLQLAAKQHSKRSVQ